MKSRKTSTGQPEETIQKPLENRTKLVVVRIYIMKRFAAFGSTVDCVKEKVRQRQNCNLTTPYRT